MSLEGYSLMEVRGIISVHFPLQKQCAILRAYRRRQAVDKSKYPDRAEEPLCQDNNSSTKKYSNGTEAQNNFTMIKVARL